MSGEFSIAVHALLYLNQKKETVSSEILAKSICTNAARVRKVMSCLKKAGLIATKEGFEGGYRFTGDSRDVTLGQVARKVNTCFVSPSWHSGRTDMDCLVASGMAPVMDALFDEMNEKCLAVLDQITLKDIEGRL